MRAILYVIAYIFRRDRIIARCEVSHIVSHDAIRSWSAVTSMDNNCSLDNIIANYSGMVLVSRTLTA